MFDLGHIFWNAFYMLRELAVGYINWCLNKPLGSQLNSQDISEEALFKSKGLDDILKKMSI